MKKILVALLSLMLIFAFASCGETNEEPAADASATDTEDTLICGIPSLLSITEEDYNAWNALIFPDSIYTYKFYDNSDSLLLALDNGDIDVTWSTDFVAEYIMQQLPDTYSFTADDTFEVIISMAVRDEDSELLTTLNDAIAALEEDGTLAALKEQYITDMDATAMPEPAELPHYDGAETVTVVITGDVPPMDYMTAEGEAAGYNIALLAAIAEKAQLNIELVSTDSASRAVMLESGKADIIFWETSFVLDINGIEKTNVDTPDGITATTPYLTTTGGYLTKIK